MLSLNLLPTSFAGPAAVATMRMPAVRMQNTPFNPNTFAASLPGKTAPLGFFDPVGFCNKNIDASEGTIR